MYILGVGPDIFRIPSPAVVYEAPPCAESNQVSCGSLANPQLLEILSHFENHSIPPDIVGYSAFIPNLSKLAVLLKVVTFISLILAQLFTVLPSTVIMIYLAGVSAKS